MRLVSFDTETYLIAPGCLAPKMVCGSWDEGAGPQLELREEALDKLEALLADADVRLCGTHVAYDFAVCARARPRVLRAVFAAYDAGRVFDISLAQALLDVAAGCLYRDPVTGAPIGRYSQLVLEKRHLQIDRTPAKKSDDGWRLRYAELDNVPVAQWPEGARVYPLDDARLCRQVAERQLSAGTNLEQMPEQARAAWALHLMSVWGIRTDAKTVAEVEAELEKAHADTFKKFKALGYFNSQGARIMATVGRKIAEMHGASGVCLSCKGKGRLVGGVGCTPCKATGFVDLGTTPLTPLGRVKTDRDTMLESGNAELIEFAETGEDEKRRSTYLPVLKSGVAVPINTSYTTFLETGRTSASRPNIQNLPRNGRIRESFVPRPGNLFCACDYGTLELVTLAQTCILLLGHSAMADAINEGKDLHNLFAAQLRHVSYEEQSAAYKTGDKTAKNFRQMAKSCNFGFPGGLGAHTMVSYARQSYNARLCLLAGKAETCGVEMRTDERSGKRVCAACADVATELKNEWFLAWPEVKEYHQYVSVATAGEMGGTVQVPGPPGVGPGHLRGGCYFCAGANNAFQGLAARGAKAALYAVSREAYTAKRGQPLHGVRPVAFIHDEILSEVPEATAHEGAVRVSEIMVSEMHRYTPDVTVKAVPVLMRAWYKSAEPVFVDGRLVPWEPKNVE